MMSSKQSPDEMLRNQKIHRHPARSASTPPSTGPRLGAVLGLWWSRLAQRTQRLQLLAAYPHNAAPTYLPRSCGGARSATTLMASAMVPGLDVSNGIWGLSRALQTRSSTALKNPENKKSRIRVLQSQSNVGGEIKDEGGYINRPPANRVGRIPNDEGYNTLTDKIRSDGEVDEFEGNIEITG